MSPTLAGFDKIDGGGADVVVASNLSTGTWVSTNCPNIGRSNLRRVPHSRIANLFGLRCPPSVPRFVMPVVVNAVERQVRTRSTANVGEEVLIRMPPLADSNAATTVILKSGVVGIIAARHHSRPYRVLRRSV